MTELTKINEVGSVPVMQSVRGVSYDKLVEQMEAQQTKFEGLFPGTEYTFKQGHWYTGWGKQKQIVDKLFRSKKVILNIPNVNYAWRTFVPTGTTDEEGRPKQRPDYVHFANPVAGEQLPSRESLGQNDKSRWPQMKDAKTGKYEPSDPFTRVLMIPFRFEGETTINHLMLQSWSSIKEAQDFLRKFGIASREHPGQLPVVELDIRVETKWDDNTVNYDVPEFNLVSWDDPIDEDEPGAENSPLKQLSAQTAGDTSVSTDDIPADGGVTSSARVEAKEAPAEDGEGVEGLFPNQQAEGEPKEGPKEPEPGKRRGSLRAVQ